MAKPLMTLLTQRLRTRLLEAEAAFWMGRFHVNIVLIWMTLIGWYSGSPFGVESPARVLRLVCLCLFVSLISSAMQIVNDLQDTDGDETTAPYLPLVAGLLSRRTAWQWSGVYFAVGFVLLYVASQSMRSLLGTVMVAVLSFFLVSVYSRVKDQGIVASIVIAIPLTVPFGVAWWVAGHQNVLQGIALLAYSVLIFITSNTIAALRDVDLDGSVGNATLPVRIGAAGALRFAVANSVGAWCIAIGVIALSPFPWWGALIAVPSITLMVSKYPTTERMVAQPGRGRLQRMRDLYPVQYSEYLRHVAVLAALEPWAGWISLFALGILRWWGDRWYDKRVTRGRINDSLTRVSLAASSTG